MTAAVKGCALLLGAVAVTLLGWATCRSRMTWR
jgi:hypothetical protein